MNQLKQQIKEKKIQGIYLLYGDEKYILNTYLSKMIDITFENSDKLMNFDIFEGNSIDLETVIDSVDTLPFLGETRMVILRNINLFKKKQIKNLDKFIDFIPKLPSTTILIIVEKEIDKRSKLYKLIKEYGFVAEFNTLSEKELLRYIANKLAKYNKKIEISTGQYFIETVGYDLSNINNELDKLIDYCSNKTIITKREIDIITTKSVENKIFDLVDCIGLKKRERALKLYHDLISIKEPPTRILYMIMRQFRLNLIAKLILKNGGNYKEVSAKLKLPVFIAKKCIQQSKRFTENQLKGAIDHCIKIEVDIKSGKLDQELGVELLIIKYSK